MASKAQSLDYRPSYLAAALAAAAVFGLYIFTLAPSTAMWDTSEYIAAAYTLGLPHPPGNPFFVLVGRVFTILPIAPNIAMRVNVLAALCSAATAFFWFLITERVLVGWLPQRWQRIAGGTLTALIGATAFTVWAQSVVNEKVYTVALAGLALVSWLVVKWCDEPDAPGADKLLILASYVMGLGYANHMAGLLTLPAMGVAVILRRPRMLLRWQLILGCAGALALYLVVPVVICVSALPISPSGLGVRENLFVHLLSAPAIGVPATPALSLSLLAYAVSLFWSVVGGLAYMTLKDRRHLRDITQAE